MAILAFQKPDKVIMLESTETVAVSNSARLSRDTDRPSATLFAAYFWPLWKALLSVR